MKTENKTITFGDITLSPAAQIAIKSMQTDEDKVICNNLSKIALSISEKLYEPEEASRMLELVHSVLLARDYLCIIGVKEVDE